MSTENIKEEIRAYIKTNIIQKEDILIANDTPLISGGIVNSISTLKMVDFLENKFKVEILPHEVDRENLDTIDLIAQFIQSKK